MRAFACVFWVCLALFPLTAQEQLRIKADIWSTLPPMKGREVQPGLAGAFIGMHGDALIIAGGANFPEGPFWEGGKKIWWKEVYVLYEGKWYVDSLPHPVAYGVSIPTSDGNRLHRRE